MNEIELEFLEEYKHLEKLLNDVFNVQHGVSEYIERLEKNKYLGSRIVSSWMNDYYSLKHVRYIRNKITHDSDASGCEEKDIDFVKDFYEKIMNHTDSLALFRMYKRKQERSPKPDDNIYQEEEKTDNRVVILLWILLFVLIIVLLYYLFFVK